MSVTLGAASSQTLWYLARGTGVVALVLLCASTVLGLLSTARVATATWPRFVVQAIHKNVSLLSVAFLGAHVATIVADSYTAIGVRDTFVPFVSSYSPFWLGLGTVSLDLLAAIIVTSLLRTRISERAWRAVHWLAYASWPTAVAHGVGMGSDRHERWFLGATLVCIVTVLAAAAWRWTHRAPATPLVVRGRVVAAPLRRSA